MSEVISIRPHLDDAELHLDIKVVREPSILVFIVIILN